RGQWRQVPLHLHWSLMGDNRDHQRPKTNPHGIPAFVAEESTQVGTDVQVFRSVKMLHKRVTEIERTSNAAHHELKRTVGELDAKVDGVGLSVAKMAGQVDILVADRRTKPSSSEHRANTLAEKLLDDEIAARKFRR